MPRGLKMYRTPFIFMHSGELKEFPYPVEHPFKTSRAAGVRKTISSMGLLAGADRAEVPPKKIGRDLLEKFHGPQYLDALEKAGAGEFDYRMLSMGLGTGDCPVFRGLYDYAVLATGATVAGAERIASGEACIAFNPSGGYHHAHANQAAGFCYINDVVLGCMTLAESGKRVLYLDVDVHHGDGVQEAFYERCDVMTISLHQDPRTLFPGTGFVDEIGRAEGKGFAVNIPLPIGTYDEAYMNAVKSIVLPLIEAYEPDCFVMEIGADALADDPLANLALTNNVYADVIGELLNFNKPILAVGGGGYNVENTVRAWSLAWAALCGQDSGEAKGGLRDKRLDINEAQRCAIEPAMKAVIGSVKKHIFGHHGL
ncbi:MAG: acetoin utilization protein AcuC [Planctomycetota bacterium]|nr:MAG: acetoin utilization protein AcuC [Planctomycetota bacterium]